MSNVSLVGDNNVGAAGVSWQVRITGDGTRPTAPQVCRRLHLCGPPTKHRRGPDLAWALAVSLSVGGAALGFYATGTNIVDNGLTTGLTNLVCGQVGLIILVILLILTILTSTWHHGAQPPPPPPPPPPRCPRWAPASPSMTRPTRRSSSRSSSSRWAANASGGCQDFHKNSANISV